MSWVPRIGGEFAGYRIEALLGHGGMSVVYRAEHLSLGRTVALKLLSPQLSEDSDFRERFTRESRVAAALDHPNIIPIFEAGEENDLFFIAMRYVEGSDLKSLLKQVPRLPADRAVSIITQVASALSAAHAKGLVHRDVKPANILIASGYGPEETDHVYLSDFGVAKHTSSRVITKTGVFVGTVDYAAPEQIEGKPIDGRADIYALGCVLYECLTGARAYDRDSEVALMYAHLLEAPPAVTTGRPELPPEIDDVVAKAMAKSRDERYPTPKEFSTGLRAALTPGAVSRVEAVDETQLAVPDTAAMTAAAATGTSPPAVAAEPLAAAAPPPAGEAPPAPAAPDRSGPEPAGRRAGGRRPWVLAAIGVAAAAALAAVLAVVLITGGDDDPAAATTAAQTSAATTEAGTSAETGATESATTAAETGPTELTLATLVPGDLWNECQVDSPPAPGATESAVCLPQEAAVHPDQWEVSTYADGAALAKAYDDAFAAAQQISPDLTRDTGRCTGTTWGGEGIWNHGPGRPGGRRFCYFDGNDAVIVWEHTKTGANGELQPDHVDTLGTARIGNSAHDQLFQWWRFWHHRVGKAVS